MVILCQNGYEEFWPENTGKPVNLGFPGKWPLKWCVLVLSYKSPRNRCTCCNTVSYALLCPRIMACA